MADNTTVTGGDSVRDKDRSGVKTQIVGLDLGIGTGTESLMSGTLPVSGTVTANAGTGTLAVSAASLPLPTGASTETTLAAQSAKLPATLGQTTMAASMAVVVASNQSAIPISGTVTSNPSGTQTVSGTVTANAGTNLNTSALALDATLGTTNTDLGGLTEAAPATDTASSGLNGRLQRVAQRLTSLIALLPSALGAGGGLKVDGSGTSLPVTVQTNATVNQAQVAGTATDTNSGVKSAGTQRIVIATDQPALTNALKVDGSAVTQPVSGTVTTNAGTNLNTSALALETTQTTANTQTGIVTETAPASDTASSGLNGRLQRIAQRLTSLIAVFTIGAGTEAAAVRVTLPTDGTGKVLAAQSGTWNVGTVTTVTAVTAITNALPAGTNAIGGVTGVGSATNASGQVTISSTSATVIASRSGRRGVLLINNQSVSVYIDAAGGTATTSKMRLDPGAAVMLPVTSAVTGITSAAYTASPADAQIHYTELY